MRGRLETFLTLAVLGLFALFIAWAEGNLNPYYQRILNTAFVYVVAAVGYNLVNGIAGQFSLGPNAFMALGGYTAALLMLPLTQKQMVWFLQPLVWPFNAFSLPGHLFIVALLAAGLVAALGGLLVGYPALRLRGDYLAIATFGFGEIIFVLANNLIPLTNGSLGIKAIPEYTNLWWSGGAAVATLLLVRNLASSSFGRAMRAIREDEVAAEAMGINIFRTKLLAFILSAFLGGIAGALLATLITTISPTLFTFTMTFNLLIIIVLGGLGSVTGSAVTALIFAFLQEGLRFLEAPTRIGPWLVPGIPGMRMVVFSLLLVFLMIFYRRGLFGRSELSWDLLLRRLPGRRQSRAPHL
ncbi:MAG: branched-chain amino acid ABC transporter permease [Firmicutes bacterium]|uniref:branched-chain amino acid ABC transporter permease n=1 Tax=Limnochorda sp. TaxID=1940279 RepID=UPI0017F26756|nr:branched-chain amino acid ABC transporter permease [Bacillota bacterium]NMA70600.1 branched-chain amino acid ABC transporter permease [Bacillota bacterium]